MNIVKLSEDLYQIPLPQGAKYPHLEWSTDLPSDRFSDTHEVVEVPLSKFLALCVDPAIPMPPRAEKWSEQKRSQYVEGQDCTKNNMGMPRIGFSKRSSNRSLWQIVCRRPKTMWAVGFVNGRHRVRIAELLGAEFIPVQINRAESEDLKAHMKL